MPRQRTARVSRLGALPRPRSQGSSPRSRAVTARRLTAFALVVVSLILLTVYLRESEDGALHGAQRLGQAALHPFEVAGERVARPFQDAYGWFADLVDVKAERDRLQAQVQDLQQRLVQQETATQENARLREVLGYVDGPRFPDDYRGIATRVLAQPANPFDQTILLAAGSSDGVVDNAPVVTADGLVGRVTRLSDGAAQVTLLTDESVVVSALDSETEAAGVVRRSTSGTTLVLDRVKKDLEVSEGDLVVTSGWQVGDLESLYPAGIPIGTVSSVGLQDIDLYQRIQVDPFVDFDAIAEVVVLVER